MSISRRKFIRHTVAGAAGAGLASVLPSSLYASPVSAADKINVALIGCKNMGFGVLKHALSFPEVNCVALCDIDRSILEARAKEVNELTGGKPQLYSDFRKMLEQKDIDAVMIGTPDHWHCLNTIYSLEAGKDVYVEKPMANTIGECNLMVKAAKRYNRLVQVGQQQRSAPIFQQAMDLIKGGKIGTLRKTNIWANFNYGLGPKPVADSPVPEGVDYNMWLGPAPERPFNKNRFHGSWRHFWDYGGGLMSDWGVHLIDMALWAKDSTEAPREVLAFAANSSKADRMRETFDTMSIIFPKKDHVVNYDLTAGVQRGPYNQLFGLAFIGDNGTLVVNRGYLEIFPEWDDELKKEKAEVVKVEKPGESHNFHVRNFLDCIKSRNVPACPPEVGRAAALHAHIPNIAARVGKSMLVWNDEKNEFENSREANKLIMPEYRSPWKLPKL